MVTIVTIGNMRKIRLTSENHMSTREGNPLAKVEAEVRMTVEKKIMALEGMVVTSTQKRKIRLTIIMIENTKDTTTLAGPTLIDKTPEIADPLTKKEIHPLITTEDMVAVTNPTIEEVVLIEISPIGEIVKKEKVDTEADMGEIEVPTREEVIEEEIEEVTETIEEEMTEVVVIEEIEETLEVEAEVITTLEEVGVDSEGEVICMKLKLITE